MKKNIKIKRTPVIILAGIVLVVLAVVLIVSFNKSDDNNEQSADVNVSKINLKPSQGQDEYTVKEETQVDILFENTAIPVGTSLKVTAIVSPDDNEKSLIWTSSNEQVFSVDKDGVITVNGVGTATLTATVGSVSDAVVIEGITKVSQGSSNGFIVYTGSNHNVTGNTYNSSGSDGQAYGSSGTDDSGTGQEQQWNPQTGSGVSGNGQQGSSSSGNSQSGSNSSGNGQAGGNSSGNGQTGGNSSGNSQSGSGNADSGQNNGNSSEDIGGMLSDNGFEQTVSNVYVCRQDGVYYGEIITQSNVTIIYIKQRNASFDGRIQSVIEDLLPGNSSYVWNSYVSASTDRTFTVDGRMVRIVVATGGGHSQIVIYN